MTRNPVRGRPVRLRASKVSCRKILHITLCAMWMFRDFCKNSHFKA